MSKTIDVINRNIICNEDNTKSIPIFKKNFFLYGEINDEKVQEVIKEIREYEDKINDLDKYCDFYQPSRVALHINSEGGNINAGFALMDYMKNSILTFSTIAEGVVMSMALPIYLIADKRYAGNFSTFHFHEASAFNFGYISTAKEELKEAERCDDILNDFICSRTKITKEKLNEIKNRKQNWYFDKKEAYKLGVVTEYTD